MQFAIIPHSTRVWESQCWLDIQLDKHLANFQVLDLCMEIQNHQRHHNKNVQFHALHGNVYLSIAIEYRGICVQQWLLYDKATSQLLSSYTIQAPNNHSDITYLFKGSISLLQPCTDTWPHNNISQIEYSSNYAMARYVITNSKLTDFKRINDCDTSCIFFDDASRRDRGENHRKLLRQLRDIVSDDFYSSASHSRLIVWYKGQHHCSSSIIRISYKIHACNKTIIVKL